MALPSVCYLFAMDVPFGWKGDKNNNRRSGGTNSHGSYVMVPGSLPCFPHGDRLFPHPDSIRAESISVCMCSILCRMQSQVTHVVCKGAYSTKTKEKRQVSCIASQHSTLMVRTIRTQREKKKKSRDPGSTSGSSRYHDERQGLGRDMTYCSVGLRTQEVDALMT